MGCATSKPPGNATAIVPSTPTTTPTTVDRYCRCVDQDQTKSFVCPVCRKIRLDVKKDVRQAQRNQRKSSLKPRNVRHRAPSEDYDPDPSSPHRHRSSSKKKNSSSTRSNRGTNRDDQNPQAHSNSNSSSETGSSNSDDYDSADQEYYPPSYDAANDPNSSYNQYQSNPKKKDKKKDKNNTTIKRQSSLQRRSAAFWAVSHKVQQMVDITKFYEMALRKLFRDYDIGKHGGTFFSSSFFFLLSSFFFLFLFCGCGCR